MLFRTLQKGNTPMGTAELVRDGINVDSNQKNCGNDCDRANESQQKPHGSC